MMIDGKEMTHAEFVRFMLMLEVEGNREFERTRGLVRIADCWVTPETAKEIEQELAQ